MPALLFAVKLHVLADVTGLIEESDPATSAVSMTPSGDHDPRPAIANGRTSGAIMRFKSVAHCEGP